MAKLTPEVNKNDHIQGPENAAVTLVEYGDYQCPYCGSAYKEIKEVQRRMGDQLRFVFRNFPLTEQHEFAEQAAEAAEAAAAQGHFWEMHDLLYENQRALGMQSLIDYAAQLGLDRQRFEQDMLKHNFQDRIYKDFMTGVRSGVNGTPTLYINGQRYDGPADAESILAELREKVR